MFRTSIALLLCVAVCFPTPPEQTDDQKRILDRARSRAKEASEAATPQVLAFFSTESFREMLEDCCPGLAKLSPEELLQRYREEASVAELAHALPAGASSGGPSPDVTLTELGNISFFPNEFQVSLMHGMNSSSGEMSDVAMQEIFGCTAFAGEAPTWSEASSRLIYVAHNMRRLDTGSIPHFGDFTVIFNSSRMKDSVLIAPYDTGMYEMNCLHPELHPSMSKTSLKAPYGQPALNCSAWSHDRKVTVPPGTLDHLDHLILPNLWTPVNGTVSSLSILDVARGLFIRSAMSGISYDKAPAIEDRIENDYFESDILANPPLPGAVKFGIAQFATLFGTQQGRDMQQMAVRYNWPLFWAYGVGVQQRPPHAHSAGSAGSAGIAGSAGSVSHSAGIASGATTEKLNRRFADPSVVKTTNASLSSAMTSNFEKVWQEAAQVRAAREVSNEDLLEWWGSLKQLKVAPISAHSCAAPHHCVAVDLATKDCICTKQEILVV